MSSFQNKDGFIIVQQLIKVIQQNKEYLSEIDGAIGDGDHGINMNKGFTLAQKRLDGKKVDMSGAMKELGTILLTEIGGSMGPLYGTFFRKMAKATKETIDKESFSEIIHAATDGISNLGNAKVGDKTLMDTLIPAVEAYDKALAQGKDFAEALTDMQDAAEKGKQSTIDMVAKIGRASRLGERSRGVLDAGATSCNLILQSIGDSIKKLIN